jgi:ribonuclease HI
MREERLKEEIRSLSPEERLRLLSWLQEVVAKEQGSAKRLSIVFDGGSRGNPGEGYGSYAFILPGEPPIVKRVEFDGVLTNNEAEYRTLIEALKEAESFLKQRGENPRLWTLDIRGDSRLVINQVCGAWAARKRRLAELRDEVRHLMKRFGSVRLSHHPRAESVKVLGH